MQRKCQHSAPVLTGCCRELISGATGAAVPTMGVPPAAPVLEGVAPDAAVAAGVAGGVVPGAGVMSTAIRCGCGWGCGST
jgi:hypothetical protein